MRGRSPGRAGGLLAELGPNDEAHACHHPIAAHGSGPLQLAPASPVCCIGRSALDGAGQDNVCIASVLYLQQSRQRLTPPTLRRLGLLPAELATEKERRPAKGSHAAEGPAGAGGAAPGDLPPLDGDQQYDKAPKPAYPAQVGSGLDVLSCPTLPDLCLGCGVRQACAPPCCCGDGTALRVAWPAPPSLLTRAPRLTFPASLLATPLQVLFRHPPDKPCPLSDQEVADLCFPHQ